MRAEAFIDGRFVPAAGGQTSSMATPFGDFKDSGHGRDRSLHAFEGYTQLKTTWISLA
jgi:acyl-CoA reductase-like NAD-dependent aldehyde dehydrogenase